MFVDDYSKYTVVYIMRNISEALEKLEEYVEMVKTPGLEINQKPKILRSGNGGGYTTPYERWFVKKPEIEELVIPSSIP